jgi:hypothetical protein
MRLLAGKTMRSQDATARGGPIRPAGVNQLEVFSAGSFAGDAQMPARFFRRRFINSPLTIAGVNRPAEPEAEA